MDHVEDRYNFENKKNGKWSFIIKQCSRYLPENTSPNFIQRDVMKFERCNPH